MLLWLRLEDHGKRNFGLELLKLNFNFDWYILTNQRIIVHLDQQLSLLFIDCYPSRSLSF